MPKRRRGARSAVVLPPRRHRRFEDLVDAALAGIPPPFAGALNEVAVVIDDEPDARQRQEHGLGAEDTLYGLYEGVPRTEWGADWSPVPNKITLFRLPLEADYPAPEDLAEQVRQTVVHELAHHLGIDDERLDELGFD